MKYGIANIKGGNAVGGGIPDVVITQNQTITQGAITLTQAQYDIIANNDVFIFDDAYIFNVKMLMKKITSSVFGTDIVCQCVYTYQGENDKEIITFQLRIPKNTLTCYVGNISNLIPTQAYSTYVIGNLTPTEDNGDYYFDMSDIEIDDLKEYDLLLTTDASDNASKLYQVDYIDSEEEKIWVLDMASFSINSQVYRHYIHLLGGSGSNIYDIDIYIENDSNEEINTLAKLKTAIKNAGIYTDNNYRPLYPLVNGKHNTYFVVGISNLDNDKIYINYGSSFNQYEITALQITQLTDLVVEK